MIRKNKVGYVYSTQEADLYSMIEKGYIKIPHLTNPKRFPFFFGVKLQPDFLMVDERDGTPIYLEVKPRFLTINGMTQLLKYLIHIREEGKDKARLGVLCAGIDPDRKEILKKLGIEIYLLKDTIVHETH